ncbi:MAG TPA: cytochrome P450 [Baekduia sp.]|nr:cytochrome P450 [Baekduia sp.]
MIPDRPSPAIVDLTDPDLFADGIPAELFATLRRESPVLWTDAPAEWPAEVGRGQWNLLRAADIRKVSRDWETFSSARGGIMMDNRDAGGLEIIRETLLGKDPPEHTRQRNILDNAFAPRRVTRLEDMVRTTIERHLDAFIAGGPGDIVEGFTKKVPLDVICDVLGIPEPDRPKVFAWAQSVVASDDPEQIRLYGRPEESRRRAYEYVEGLLAERSRCPADDLATFFTTATVDGGPVPDDHRIGLFRQLFEAGADTTMNTMTAGIKALSDHPDQWQLLREDRSLVPSAVEEMLRWASAVVYFRRTATCDVEVGGQLIREGDAVVMWYASGNRDEAAFDRPDTFDVTREKCPHFAFGGGGRHFCVGASLARLELRLMLEALLDRVPDLRVAGPMRRTRSNIVLGVTELPVTFSAPQGTS